MRNRFFGPVGLCCAFACISALVIGGLSWVTVASLHVEQSQAETTVRADRSNKERLALWRLDSQLLPTLGLENNRPFAHYTALHAPYPAVDTEQDVLAPGTLRLPSPLLSADLPPWQLLHFQIDPETGWQSPQVLHPDLAERLSAAPFHLSLANVGPQRTAKLAELRKRFPAADVIQALSEAEQATPDGSPFFVPVPFLDETSLSKPGYVPGDSDPSDARPLGPVSVEKRSLGYERSLRASSVGTGRGGAPMAPGMTPQGAPAAGGGFGGGAAPGSLPVASAKADAAAPGGPSPAVAQGFSRQNATEIPAPKAVAQSPPPAPVAVVPPPVQSGGVAQQSQTTNGLQLPYGTRGAQPTTDQINEMLDKAKEFGARLRATQKSQESRGGLENSGNMKNSANYGPQVPAPAEKPGDAQNNRAAGAGPAGPTADSKAKAVGRDKDGLNEEGKRAVGAAVPAVKGERAEAQRKAGEDPKKLADRDENAGKDSSDKQRDDLRRGANDLDNKEFAANLKQPEAEGAARLAKGPANSFVIIDEFVPGAKKAGPSVQPVAVHLGPMRPHWLTAPDGSEILVLVRAVRLENRTVYQGVVLDWPLLRAMLGEQVADLFPQASLSPVRTVAELSPERAMTALPVQLDPGPVPEPPPAGWTPLRFGLALAWAAALLALAAVGFGGRAIVGMSERRIRFVSAVTHELRTPLTSMRLYLDLLNSGMIEDEAKQKEYLKTLASESDRLNRLVENVLDFARLEKRSDMATLQPVGIAMILDDVHQTWTDRCAADAMELVVISTLPNDQRVTTDLRMATQVLGNLVDNARKYARGCDDQRIWLWAKPGERGKILLEVEDRGPGVPASERGTVFRAFRRGKAAETVAGGAGLGLALARQWAELIGGQLSYRPADGGVGACFRLELPASST